MARRFSLATGLVLMPVLFSLLPLPPVKSVLAGAPSSAGPGSSAAAQGHAHA